MRPIEFAWSTVLTVQHTPRLSRGVATLFRMRSPLTIQYSTVQYSTCSKTGTGFYCNWVNVVPEKTNTSPGHPYDTYSTVHDIQYSRIQYLQYLRYVVEQFLCMLCASRQVRPASGASVFFHSHAPSQVGRKANSTKAPHRFYSTADPKFFPTWRSPFPMCAPQR